MMNSGSSSRFFSASGSIAGKKRYWGIWSWRANWGEEKMAPSYCRAVLNHQQRIALDGSPAEMVEAEARDLAIKHLARRAAESSRRRVAPNFIMG